MARGNIDVRRVGFIHLSYFITIPARFAQVMKLQKGDFVEVALENGRLVVKPLYRPGKGEDDEGRTN